MNLKVIVCLASLLGVIEAKALDTPRPRTKEEAIALVRPHVVPKKCFIEKEAHTGNWRPIPGKNGAICGTGCAHWVAHQKKIKARIHCLKGYAVRVPDVVKDLLPFTDLKTVETGDIWAWNSVRGKSDHCGIVSAVRKGPRGEPKITIKHCSSLNERGVVEDDYKMHFGSGHFYRSPEKLFSGKWLSPKGNFELSIDAARKTCKIVETGGATVSFVDWSLRGRTIFFTWSSRMFSERHSLTMSDSGNELTGSWTNSKGKTVSGKFTRFYEKSADDPDAILGKWTKGLGGSFMGSAPPVPLKGEGAMTIEVVKAVGGGQVYEGKIVELGPLYKRMGKQLAPGDVYIRFTLKDTSKGVPMFKVERRTPWDKNRPWTTWRRTAILGVKKGVIFGDRDLWVRKKSE